MDHDELTNRRVHAIAKAHSCTIDDVHAALDRHPIELNRDAYLRRTLALELMRLDQLEMAFEGKALKDKDVPAGVLMVKIAERRATLLGLNPSPGFAVQVIQPPPQHKTSTQEIRGVLDNILHISQRERELINTEEDEGFDPQRRPEINQLRIARGKPALSDSDGPEG